MKLSFQTMHHDEAQRFAQIQTDAFMGYDYFSVFMPKDKRRRHFLKNLFDAGVIVNEGVAHFLTAKDENGRMVAACELWPPGYRHPSDLEYTRKGFWKSVLWGGPLRVMAWLRIEDECIEPCMQLPNAWYVNSLTVDPACQGQHIGSRMLQEGIFEHVRDQGGTRVCLFTNAQINREFYTKNGFEEFHESSFVYHGKHVGSWSYRIELQPKNDHEQTRP